jgi:hypothetical protein
MKRLVIVLVALTLFLAGFAFSQDCSQCPSKSKCGKTKVEKKADKTVYISLTRKKGKKLYHKKNGCIIKNAVPMSLEKAGKKKYQPCPICFPKTEKIVKKDKKK